MKTLLQTFRRPIKSIFGIIIIAVAITGLVIGIGQAYVSAKTDTTIQSSFSTVALPVVGYSSDYSGPIINMMAGLPKKITAWIDGLPQEYPELVKKIAKPSLASAYISQLNLDNCTRHPNFKNLIVINYMAQPQPIGSPYSCAVLEVTLTEVGEVTERPFYYRDGSSFGTVPGNGIRVNLTGTVNRAIGLESGYNDPAGYRISMSLTLPSEEAYHALQIAVGERYLVYGQDYYDNDWDLRSSLFRFNGMEYLQAFQEENLVYEENPTPELWARYTNDGNRYALSQKDMERYHSITLSLIDLSAMPVFETVTDENGNVTAVRTDNYTILDENGNTVSVTAEEYRLRYGVPTIVKLEGTAEEFLASKEAELWNTMLHNIEVNSHAFPMIGVDSLGYIAEFARENARIVQGRDFTVEELNTGAKVCIISESLAAANGIQVGDTLECRFYNYDYSSPYQDFIHEGLGIVNPSAYFYTANTPFHGEAEGYVVIGLYRQNNEWADVKDNSYAFTPNTIFVPNTSLSSMVDYAENGLFKTLVIENGKVVDFANIVIEAGYDGLFTYYDQGYSEIEDGFLDYQKSAAMALRIGLVLYGVGLLAVLILFPLSQRKNLYIMRSLGANRIWRIWYALQHTLCILVPGTVLGYVAANLLWNNVMEALTASSQLAFSPQLDSGLLQTIAAAQLLVAALLALVVSVLISGRKNVMKKR